MPGVPVNLGEVPTGDARVPGLLVQLARWVWHVHVGRRVYTYAWRARQLSRVSGAASRLLRRMRARARSASLLLLLQHQLQVHVAPRPAAAAVGRAAAAAAIIVASY